MNAQAHAKQVQASIFGVFVQTICLDTSAPKAARCPLSCEFLSMMEINWSSSMLSVTWYCEEIVCRPLA